MTEQSAAALETALAYHRAWTNDDFERAMTYIADDIVCDAPSGRFEGAEAFRGFMGPFTQILTRSELLAAFGDDTTAVLMYDTDTVPVNGAPGAEWVRVVDGQIAQMRIIFDRTPFDAARRASASMASGSE
ncbi:nuclear transport factor 2 family protein [Actinobacteria bacterium YIM 96077]|uniref:Nuclear transport factor 2 family protein n=1 Tax=Phytoactinopolyspora halophila TaxID=1981511 RepID=A0A329QUI7_9ACTN|nr:nuclear transport factor 2 family protein [Phytoactinopolyspora halophila]AYY13770.1 nuclear transport factor 2 family protein [Actinobacteria bacterium YIM 96077]RAW15686.1 nuclear transport factor 2 family protein [Phytoactinopolyspora halophila]